jgi:hypothetical protein
MKEYNDEHIIIRFLGIRLEFKNPTTWTPLILGMVIVAVILFKVL